MIVATLERVTLSSVLSRSYRLSLTLKAIMIPWIDIYIAAAIW